MADDFIELPGGKGSKNAVSQMHVVGGDINQGDRVRFTKAANANHWKLTDDAADDADGAEKKKKMPRLPFEVDDVRVVKSFDPTGKFITVADANGEVMKVEAKDGWKKPASSVNASSWCRAIKRSRAMMSCTGCWR